MRGFACLLAYLIGVFAAIRIMLMGLIALLSPVEQTPSAALHATARSKLTPVVEPTAKHKLLTPVYPASPGKELLGSAPKSALFHKMPHKHDVAHLVRKPKHERARELANGPA